MPNDRNLCELRLPYLLKELPLLDAKAFVRHLELCEACREEMADLSLAWEALSSTVEEQEVPDGLREQVLEAVLLSNPSSDTKSAPPIRPRLLSYAVASVLLLAAGGLAVWGWNHGEGSGVQSAAQQELQIPAQVIKQFSLASFDQGMPGAAGSGWLTEKGETVCLVLQMSGLRPTAGEEAYQLWVIHEGKRRNGGTFRVDAQGNGVITFDMKREEAVFESLGITLEPDARGSQPRGKKVLGT